LRGRAEVARWAHNPKVVGSNPAPATKKPQIWGFYFMIMYTTYALHSPQFDKIYIGYTSNIENRLLLHNSISDKGFTLKYRPWVLIYSEEYETKREAMLREKQLKTAVGRKFVRQLISKKT
jgi:putative endonuclease